MADKQGTGLSLVTKEGIGSPKEALHYLFGLVNISGEHSQDLGKSYIFRGEPLSHYINALKGGFLTDITFLVGENENMRAIEAHKLVLALNSSVFQAMFFGSLPECGPNIEINDIEPEVFAIFLEFLYSGLLPTNMPVEFVINVLGCAHKYDIGSLERLIVTHFEKILDFKNVLRILEVSIFFDQTELENECWEFTDKNTGAIVAQDEFVNVNFQTLKKILKRDSLNINESLLFAGVLRWANAECVRLDQEQSSDNLRNILGDNLKLLRLASMTSTDFADGPGKSGILTDAEIGNVLLHICSTEKAIPTLVLFSPVKRGLSHFPILVPCNCIAVQSNCFFCIKGIPRRGVGAGRSSLTSILWKSQIPQCYCQCRIRGRCPGSSGCGSGYLDRKIKRPFSSNTLGLIS